MKGKLLFLFLILIILFIYNFIEISQFKINKTTIKTNKLKRNNQIKIVQISDYHNNKLVNKNKLLKSIKKIKPDIIVLTGDIISDKTKDFVDTLSLIKNLCNITENIFFVHGNHEIGNNKGREFVSQMQRLGIHVLENKNEKINVKGENINICGVGFYINKNDFQRSLNNIDEELYTILLSHSPNRPLRFTEGKEDLIISGHTHGGQVRLPLIGAIMAPGQGFFPRYSKGFYKVDDVQLYIDSGMGNSTWPMRFLNRIQFTFITIEGE